jgi:asparagine synthase (glutamine-hydrolysing)
MCGLAGFSARLPLGEGPLREAVARLRHRGPDARGIGIVDEGRVGLGHARLSIIDLSEAGTQPLYLKQAGLALIYNGEIYNYRELRAELIAGGAEFTTGTDTEVLLHGYRAWGDGVLDRLRGIFAFALWDQRAGELLLARDQLGIKPLYIAEGQGITAFASELKALAPMVPRSSSIDPVAVASYLTFLWCPGERTPAVGVRKLGAGHAMRLAQGRILREWRYWDLPAYTPRAFESLGACANQIGQTLERVVHQQMVADAPVGAFLSGGVDSTAIVAAARKINPEISCFTIRPTGPIDSGETPDLPFAREAARSLGVPLTEVPVDSASMAIDLEQMVYMLDEPLADPACLNVLYISRSAREAGLKVLLSGAGGDDVFSGYRRHTALYLADRVGRVPRSVFGATSAIFALFSHFAPARKASKLAGILACKPDERIVQAFRWLDASRMHGLLSPELRVQLAAGAEEACMRSALEHAGTIPELERCLFLEKRFFLTDHNLIYTDRMGMAAGIEIRVPLLDLELLDLAAQIPFDWKMAKGDPKHVFKLSQVGRIPKSVINRPKAGFGAPLRRWLDGALRPLIDDLLAADTIRARGLYDVAAIERLRADDRAGTIDAAYPILALACMELWCRGFVDGGTAAAPASFPLVQTP